MKNIDEKTGEVLEIEDVVEEVSLTNRPATEVAMAPDIDGFLAVRKDFIEKVNKIMVEKADYHVIQGRKSLGKGGAEKIASIFGWHASFTADKEALEMFGNAKGLVAFVCTLTDKNGVFVGEGRGSASLDKNQSDPNKTLKMAQKSAFIDATLRASGLSDFFTQDIEDMNLGDIGSHHVEEGTKEDVPFVNDPNIESYVISRGVNKGKTGYRVAKGLEPKECPVCQAKDFKLQMHPQWGNYYQCDSCKQIVGIEK